MSKLVYEVSYLGLDLIGGRRAKLELVSRAECLIEKSLTSTPTIPSLSPNHDARLRILLHRRSPVLPTQCCVQLLSELFGAAAPRLRQASIVRPQIHNHTTRSSRFAPSIVFPSIRCYSAPAGLSKEEVQGRIMDLLKNFDKVCVKESSNTTHSSLTLSRLRMLQRYQTA